MSTGQTLLSLGAIALFMYLSMNINHSYLTATQQTVDQQTKMETVNFGQSLAEEIYATNYDELVAIYSNFNDETDPGKSYTYDNRLSKNSTPDFPRVKHFKTDSWKETISKISN